MDGYYAFGMHKNVGNRADRLEERLKGDGLENIGSVNVMDLGDQNYGYSAQISNELELFNDQIVIKPFLSFVPEEVPFTQKSRKYPIDFIFAEAHNLSSQIFIPEGYHVESLPTEISFDNDIASLTIAYTQENNMITAKGEYQFKKAVYPPEAYQKLKRNYTQIVNFLNKEIILTPDTITEE